MKRKKLMFKMLLVILLSVASQARSVRWRWELGVRLEVALVMLFLMVILGLLLVELLEVQR